MGGGAEVASGAEGEHQKFCISCLGLPVEMHTCLASVAEKMLAWTVAGPVCQDCECPRGLRALTGPLQGLRV